LKVKEEYLQVKDSKRLWPNAAAIASFVTTD